MVPALSRAFSFGETLMPNWRNEYRRCDNCRGEYLPQREAQSYCSRRCKRDASYTRERLLKGGPRSVRKRRLARVVPGTVRNGPFSSTKSASSRALNIPDFGALVREQIIARQHLENPITIFLSDGSQGRVWLATDKHGSKIIGDELHWRVNVREAIRDDQRPTRHCRLKGAD